MVIFGFRIIYSLDCVDLISSISTVLRDYPDASFVLCYQDRGILYSIDEYLERYSLKCTLIPYSFDTDAFLAYNPHLSSLFSERPILILLEIARKDADFHFLIA